MGWYICYLIYPQQSSLLQIITIILVDTFKKYQAYLAGIREIQGYFSNEIREGSRLEGLGKLESAIELYERLVAEKCYRTTSYERLAIIYTKMKREDDLRRILNSGIIAVR